MLLTGVHVIETGVINRGDGIGNLSTVKKVASYDGLKVYFSTPSYKSAMWESLQKFNGWKKPMFSSKQDGGVVQRSGTIIDSEELDFGGTMVAKPIRYNRVNTLAIDDGISVNNFKGNEDFGTNMRLAKMADGETNIKNKENFHGIYILPFVLEIDRVGVQEIEAIDMKIEEKDALEIKIGKIYEGINKAEDLKKLFDGEDGMNVKNDFVSKVEKINYDKSKKLTAITLKPEERSRRIKDVLLKMGDLNKKIEGASRNLVPFFSAFSFDYTSPKYALKIESILKQKKPLTKEELEKFASDSGKNILIADIDSYDGVVGELMEQVDKHLGIKK